MKKWFEWLGTSCVDGSGRCQLSCLGCSVWERSAKEAVAVDKLICKKVKQKTLKLPTRWVNITGGDPFENPYLPTILSAIKQQGVRIRLWSHGHVSPDFLEAVIPQVNEFVCYIPSPNSKQYRIETGTDGLAQVLENLDGVRQRVPTKISYRVTPENIDWLPEIYELAYQKKYWLWVMYNKKAEFTGDSIQFIKRYYRVKNVYVFEDMYRVKNRCQGFSSGVLSGWQWIKNRGCHLFYSSV